MSITGRVRHVLIVGASSGIGAALARSYAAPGIVLSIIGRDASRLAAVADVCRASGAEVGVQIADVRDGARMHRLLLEIDTKLAIDVLIANAGLGGASAMAGAAGEAPEAARDIAAVNFGGTVNTVAPLLERLVARRHGAIVLISSLAAGMDMPSSPVYAASKAGVSAYARSLRSLLAGSGVVVSLVLPGFVDTPMSQSLPGPRPGLVSAQKAAELIKNGVEKGHATIAFPASIVLATRIGALLPTWLIRMISQRWTPRG